MKQRLPAFAVLSCAVCLTGCAGMSLWTGLKSKIPQADQKNPVVRIIALWEPSEGRGLDDLPTRGFAGQILFFTAGNATPVQVHGDVRVTLYDDQGTAGDQAKPIHQFDFVGDAWNIHLHDGMLGPSYQFFLPYVRKHSYRAKCGLRVRLKPEHGPTTYSDMVRVTLPGPSREKPAETGDRADLRKLIDRKPEPVPEPPLGASLQTHRVQAKVVTDAPDDGSPAPRRFRLAPAKALEPVNDQEKYSFDQ